jgi:N-acetylneuraminic acid mutarotase
MSHRLLRNALVLGLVGVGGISCTESGSSPDPTSGSPAADRLKVQEPLRLDAASNTLTLDTTKVPVLPSCSSGQLVHKTATGWDCVSPGPGGSAVLWDAISNKPTHFPPEAHRHDFSELGGLGLESEWPGTQRWSRVTGAPDFALSSTVSAVSGRVATAESKLAGVEAKVTKLEERVGSGSGQIQMSIHPRDSALLAAGYGVVGLGRPESFTSRANSVAPISHVTSAAVLGTKVYVAGGYNGAAMSNLREYDLVTEKWTNRQQMAGGRYGHVVVGAKGKVYAMGGYGTAGSKVNEIYDPALNVWTVGAPLPDHEHHASAHGILSDGKLHIVGGYNHTTNATSRTHIVYDFETDSWSTARDMPASVYWAASGVLPDGRLIVSGGHSGSACRSETYIYDPATDSWTQVASMPTALQVHSGAVIAGRFHVFMGHNCSATNNYHYVYDPLTDTWSSATAIPYTTYTPAVAQLRGGALVMGGWNGSAYSTVYEYLAPLYLYAK